MSRRRACCSTESPRHPRAGVFQSTCRDNRELPDARQRRGMDLRLPGRIAGARLEQDGFRRLAGLHRLRPLRRTRYQAHQPVAPEALLQHSFVKQKVRAPILGGAAREGLAVGRRAGALRIDAGILDLMTQARRFQVRVRYLHILGHVFGGGST